MRRKKGEGKGTLAETLRTKSVYRDRRGRGESFKCGGGEGVLAEGTLSGERQI